MIRKPILAAALLALTGCDPERTGGTPAAPMPKEKTSATSAPVSPPYYPSGAPLTEEALDRILRQQLLPLFAKVDALNVDLQALALKVGNLERASADEQKLVRDKLAEHQKAIDELRDAFNKLPVRSGAPKAQQTQAADELERKVNALTEQVKKQKKQIDALRKEPAAPPAPVAQAPQLPRLLPARSRATGASG
jgi:hypothetical protein